MRIAAFFIVKYLHGCDKQCLETLILGVIWPGSPNHNPSCVLKYQVYLSCSSEMMTENPNFATGNPNPRYDMACKPYIIIIVYI